MKLHHLLTVIALGFPLASQAESEFSYDYVELSVAHTTVERDETDGESNGNKYALKFSKELFFQVIAKVDALYLNADNKTETSSGLVESEIKGYGYDLQLGRYFELHNRVHAVVVARHARLHSQVTYKGSNQLGPYMGKVNDVDLSFAINTGLRIHLDSEKRFELMPNISTNFHDEGEADTSYELGLGFAPIKELQVIAGYSTTPSDDNNSTFSAAVRWNF